MADNESSTSSAAGKNSLVGKLIVVGFIGVVILGECLLAYFLIPSADEVAAATKTKLVEELKVNDDGDGVAPLDESTPVSEVELGKFNLSLYQQASNTSRSIDCVVVGIITQQEKADFDMLFKNNEHRLRDRIIQEFRNSDAAELNDGGLGLIKRRILEKSNAVFGKRILREVLFSEYSFVEQ